MGVQKFLKSAFKASLRTFDAEPVTVAGVVIAGGAVIDETQSSTPQGSSAKNNRRTLVIQFSTDAFTGLIKSGDIVEARGEKWQVSAEDGSIKRGQVATTLTIVEPERRDDGY